MRLHMARLGFALREASEARRGVATSAHTFLTLFARYTLSEQDFPGYAL